VLTLNVFRQRTILFTGLTLTSYEWRETGCQMVERLVC
jgi:hypothetical protein